MRGKTNLFCLFIGKHKNLKNKILTGTTLPKKKFTGLKAGVLFESSGKMRNGRVAQHQ